MASTASIIRCRAESVPIVMSVPQKSENYEYVLIILVCSIQSEWVLQSAKRKFFKINTKLDQLPADEVPERSKNPNNFYNQDKFHV